MQSQVTAPFFAACAILLHLVGLRLDHPQDLFKLCVVALILTPCLGGPDLVVSLDCDARVAFGDLKTRDVNQNWDNHWPTMITCEMFSVFGFFKASSMKYLSPRGVCFTLAASIEQSVENGAYSLF